MNIDELYKIIQERKLNPQKDSYVSTLFKEGEDRIIQKVGEESVEVIVSAKNRKKKEIISEVADLWFHTLVLLSTLKITPNEVMKELSKRKK